MIGRDRAARLAHDVGKYVARTARNLPAGAVPEAVLAMLVADLWDLPAGGRASAVLARIAPEAATTADPWLARAHAALSAIDTLESAVRRGEPAAIREAAALALEVETVLRALAHAARSRS